MNVGKVSSRINKIMQEKNISIDEFENRTGLNRNFLDLLQKEKDIEPSLGPLLKISRMLGIRLGTLLDDQVSKDPLVIRCDERKEGLSILPSKEKSATLNFFSLGRGKTDRHMEPFFVEVLPESAKDKKLSAHEGEEFIVVTSGEIEVIYGKEVHRLKAGDSIYYNSVVPHYVSCASNDKATIYAVLYIPE